MTSGHLGIRASGHLRIGRSGYWAIGAIAFVSLAFAGCTLGSPTTPSLSGPSALSVAFVLTASPDLMVRDGIAQSVITVTVRDANAQPVRNLAMRMDITVGGSLADLGTLSSRNITTGSDGRATVIYTAPPPAAFGAPNTTTVQVFATPVGTDYANTISSAVSIHLTTPGIILPPNGTPVPSFFASPSAPHERESVSFDGSASMDPDGIITSYVWNFGDGATGTGKTTSHTYDLAGAYLATLTVTDDQGLSVASAPVTVTVVSAANPVASFTFSPTDAKAGDTVNFNASASSVPPGREIRTYQWDFGDGTSLTTSTPTASHPYLVAKTYAVVLTVIDDIGRRATFTLTVTVNP